MERRFSVRQLAGILAFTVILSVLATTGAIYLINAYHTRYTIGFDSKAVKLENVNKFNQVRTILKEDYYQSVDENTLIEGAVSGLADSLKDPYTVYFNKDQMRTFMEKSEGSYVGIGVSVNTDENGILTVIEPFDNSPAKLAGIRQGDKIVKVDETDVTAIRDENMIISMIKGTENTHVKITIYRSGENKYKQFDIVRKRIKTSNIKSELLEDKVGYIRLVMFDSEIAPYFKRDLDSLLSKGIKGLIIDLRDNPGGSYEQVVEIADRLLPEGTIVYTEDRAGKKQIKISNKSALDIPVVLLTNGNSASASEILAGAVKDNARGTLVGTKTFGKGLVQELRMLDDGSGIKVTIARYFTPSGVCIQGVGIKPDIEIDLPAEFKNVAVSQIPRDKDVQLKKALETLKGKMAAE